MASYNVYCDESCHLENDHQKVMVIGAVWCPVKRTRTLSKELRAIKARHGLAPDFEVKWIKVSPAKKDFYVEWINTFLADDDLHLRALLVPDKGKLRHDQFEQDHDTWYYKMFFQMLRKIFDSNSQYFVYLDMKDTRGAKKVQKLYDILCDHTLDFSRQMIQRFQLMRSKESEILQMTNLLIGAISYVNRGLTSNAGKVAVAQRLREGSGKSLTSSTSLRDMKLNIFKWNPQEFA